MHVQSCIYPLTQHFLYSLRTVEDNKSKVLKQIFKNVTLKYAHN